MKSVAETTRVVVSATLIFFASKQKQEHLLFRERTKKKKFQKKINFFQKHPPYPRLEGRLLSGYLRIFGKFTKRLE